MKFHLRHIPCLLCGSAELTPLLPSAKFDDKQLAQVIHDKIDVCLCENCGLVFENPQVELTKFGEYADKHYYNPINKVPDQYRYQRMVSAFRWNLLKHRLPWDEISKALDVGATGAWSALIKAKSPAMESVLLEPSSEAVAMCRERHPEVRAELGVFEEFTDHDESYDLITFYYSLYMLSNPRRALAKTRRLLRDGGRLVICISHLLMETEVWINSLPWVNMTHVIRGVQLVYYSRRTLERFLWVEGFEIESDFTINLMDDHEHSGRQEYYVIASKASSVPSKIDACDLSDPTECEASRAFFLRYCDIVSERSVARFFDTNEVEAVLLQHDGDPTYLSWLFSKLAPFCDQIISVETPPGVTPVSLPKAADQPGYVILNATGRPSAAGVTAHSWRHLRVIDCCHPTDAPYGSWVRNQDGEVLITRAFCPVMEHGFELFPFARHKAVNELTAAPPLGRRADSSAAVTGGI